MDASDPNTQWGGAVRIEVVIDHADSVAAMKASAVAAAKEILSRVTAEMTIDAVVIGPRAVS